MTDEIDRTDQHAPDPDEVGEPAAEIPAEQSAEPGLSEVDDEVAAITASLDEPAAEEPTADGGAPHGEPPTDGGVPTEEPPTEGSAPVEERPTGDDAPVEEPPAEGGALIEAPPATDVPAEPALMDLGPERRTAWWVWVLGVFGVIAVGVAGWALWYYFLSPVTVPKVVGKDVGQATQALNDGNLRLGRTSEEPTSAAPAGTVISQDPKAGVEVERDVEVSLVIAAPPTTSSVPDVKGQKLEEAQKTLAGEQLGTATVETFDAGVAAGFVISQLPSAGVELPPGSLVALAVSKGPSPSMTTVPNLNGVSSEEAQKVLASLDLVPAAYKSNDASVPAGQIATQSPAAGTKVPVRSTVMYLVSDGRAFNPVTVPDVVNTASKSATSKIKSAGLVAKSRQVAHPSVPAGNVIAQMPLAGAKVVKGSNVGLLVSRGPAETLPVPSVVGTGQAEAAKAITAAGFKPVMLPTPVVDGTVGQVVAQWPEAKTSWPQYLPVIAIYRQ